MHDRAPVHPSRCIVANLDCELDFAACPAEPAETRVRSTERSELRASSRMPLRLRRTLGALGTLLRVFARSGDRLWTLHPVAPERMCAAFGLAAPTLTSGPLSVLAPAPRLLSWGETEQVAALRQQSAAAPMHDFGDQLADRVWQIPASAPHIAARANDRLFQLEIDHRLGFGLPGAARVSSLTEVEQHLAAGGAHVAVDSRWVLKAPLSAAGRDRVLGGPNTLRDPSRRRRIVRLLQRFGALVFEPWVRRVADFACCLLVDDRGVELLGLHRLHVHPGGGFVAVSVGKVGQLALAPDERARIEQVAETVGDVLWQLGYRGPMSIDGYRYVQANGQHMVNALGEINARMTFGLVAWALAQRVGALGAGENGMCLRIGTQKQLGERTDGAVALLHGDREDPTTAWIEL